MNRTLFRSETQVAICLVPRRIINTIFSFAAFLFGMLSTATATAQTAAPNWLEDSLYASGKINTVIIVVAVILIGISIWLFALDRKLRKLEEKINKPSI